MTAIELLKQGIETQNWEDIQKVYAMFTGLPVPEATKTKEKKAKSAPTPPPAKPVDEYDVNNFIVTGNRNTTAVDADGKRKARTEPINVNKIRAVGNMWTDEKNIATADMAIDRLIKHQQIPKRPAQQQRIYTCVGTCGLKVKLYPSQVPTGEYKCAQCIQQTQRS